MRGHWRANGGNALGGVAVWPPMACYCAEYGCIGRGWIDRLNGPMEAQWRRFEAIESALEAWTGPHGAGTPNAGALGAVWRFFACVWSFFSFFFLPPPLTAYAPPKIFRIFPVSPDSGQCGINTMKMNGLFFSFYGGGVRCGMGCCESHAGGG